MPKKVCEVKGCEGCPMAKKYPDNTFVAPRLGTNLRLAIGEAPGAVEEAAGEPFAGSSGGWFRTMYTKAGLDEKATSVLNVIQCRPPNDIFPTDSAARFYITDKEAYEAVDHCKREHVLPFLKSRPWQRVDVLGDKPLRFVLDKPSGITRWRGSVLPVPALDGKRIAVPTFHPTYIARDQSMFPIAVNDLRKTLAVDPEDYILYPTIEDVRRFTATKFAFDIETSGWTETITMVGLSAENFKSIVVPFQGAYIEELKRIFWNATEVIGQNLIQFDLPVLEKSGVRIRGPQECMVWDIMLMHHLRFPSFPHDLEFIGKQFTNKGAWKYDKLVYEAYCARDVDVTWRCFEPLYQLCKSSDLLNQYKYISWPLAKICKLMTDTGVQRSTSRLKVLREETLANIAAAEKELPDELKPRRIPKQKRKKAPEGVLTKDGRQRKYILVDGFKEIVPWKSSEVKKKYLYETLGLPVQYNIKTKLPSSDKNALDKLYTRHKLPVLKTLKDLSKWATLLSGFAKEGTVENDVLHPSFNVHGTETGRLSSSNPNFQNQPATVRFTYVPRTPGGKIISVDYSGIENRLVAFLAQDRKRLHWFRDPKFSEHKYLAGILSDTPYDQVVKSKEKDSPYAMAKVVVHGSDRMMGAKKISEQYDVDFATTKDFQARWKREIADSVAWQKRVSDAGARQGWTRNPFGRMLWVWEQGSATRIVSFQPQSTAADVIFRAMIALMYERIGWPKEWALLVAPVVAPLPEGCLLIAQVHDELVVETTTADLVQPALTALRTVMTQPWPELRGLSLPIGEAFGDSWGDCE